MLVYLLFRAEHGSQLVCEKIIWVGQRPRWEKKFSLVFSLCRFGLTTGELKKENYNQSRRKKRKGTSKSTHLIRVPGFPRDWKTWEKEEHLPVREFCSDWKSQGILPKTLEKYRK